MDVRLVFLFIISHFTGCIWADCMLNMKDDLGIDHPLLLSLNSPNWISLSSSPKGFVTIGKDDRIRLVCPSKDPANKNFFSKFKESDVLTAKCKNGNGFEVDKKTYAFDELQCERPAEATEIKTNEQCLGKDTETIKVGFKFGSEFVPEYKVCFNKKDQSTLYTEVTVPASIDKAVIQNKELTWSPGNNELFKDVNINTAYSCETQKVIFKRILNKDFFDNNRCCLEKGSLVSTNDMIFLPQQASTANYLNTVPQWSTCNRANWKEIEKRVKNLATSLNRPLTVWTGTYRNMRLAAKWGFTYKDMYLHYVDSSHKAVPVPLYIWKVVYDPQSQKAVAIIEINNPHMSLTDVDSYVLCEDKCKNVNWLNFLDRKTIINGYIYCCDLPDFEFGFAFKNSPFPKATGGLLRDERSG